MGGLNHPESMNNASAGSESGGRRNADRAAKRMRKRMRSLDSGLHQAFASVRSG